MKHIKLFESYYKDLTPYEYGRKKDSLNIGWIGSEENFETGEVSDEFIEKLKMIESDDEHTTERHKGFHRCELCGELLGSCVKRISSKDKSYSFPSKMSHYVTSHSYKPPQEFIDTIMNTKVQEKVKKNINNEIGRAHV